MWKNVYLCVGGGWERECSGYVGRGKVGDVNGVDGVGAGANDAEGTLAGVARAPVAATLLPAQLFALGGGGCHRLACITDLPTCPMVCLACAGARSR